MLARGASAAANTAPLVPAACRRLAPRSCVHRSQRLTTAAVTEDSPLDGSGGAGATAGGGSSQQPPAPSAVAITYRGRQVQAPRGATLRTALLEGGVSPHNGRATLINCRGLGTCGTCAVEVRGQVEPGQWTPQEQLRLSFPPHGPPGNARLRLACQVACQGDLTVTKRSRFWGQGDDVLPDLPSATGAAGAAGAAGAEVMPLGQLEFVLDRRRKRPQGQQE